MSGGWEGMNCAVCGRSIKLTENGWVHAENNSAYWPRPDGKDDHCVRVAWPSRRKNQ